MHELYPTGAHPDEKNKARYIYHSLNAARSRLQGIRDNVAIVWPNSTTQDSRARVSSGYEVGGFEVYDEFGVGRHGYWVEKVRLGDGCLGGGAAM